MKPPLIKQHPEKVRDALLDNKLGCLIDYLEDPEYMKNSLERYFRRLQKRQQAIPLELDWVYAQYNVSISRLPNPQNSN